MDDQAIQRMAQFLATEHSTLQAARSALVAESVGRISSFLTTVSAGMVTLALVFQISRFGELFILFSMILIAALGVVGISAYVRVVQLDFADIVYVSAINRIRHFYLQTTPEIRQHLSFPAFDDERSVSRARVVYTSFFWTVLSYPAGLILVINSLLAGALCSLIIIALFPVHILPSAAAGIIVFLLAAVVQYRLGFKWAADVRKDFQPRFPEPGKASHPQE